MKLPLFLFYTPFTQLAIIVGYFNHFLYSSALSPTCIIRFVSLRSYLLKSAYAFIFRLHPQLSSVFSRYPPLFDAAKQFDFYLSCLDVRRPILLSGIPRSGSTYAWNALRFICDFRFNLIKDHNFLAWSRKRARYALHGSTIVTIRNPYSLVTSLSRVLSIGTKTLYSSKKSGY